MPKMSMLRPSGVDSHSAAHGCTATSTQGGHWHVPRDRLTRVRHPYRVSCLQATWGLRRCARLSRAKTGGLSPALASADRGSWHVGSRTVHGAAGQARGRLSCEQVRPAAPHHEGIMLWVSSPVGPVPTQSGAHPRPVLTSAACASWLRPPELRHPPLVAVPPLPTLFARNRWPSHASPRA